jgi:hypothetical protein
VIFCFAIVEITRKVIVCFSVKANWLQFTTKYSTQGPIREILSEFTDFKMERKILFMKVLLPYSLRIFELNVSPIV